MSEEDAVFELDDPMVGELGRFLQNAPLSNGTYARIPSGQSELLAQAALNWLNLLVWDGGEWAPRAQIEAAEFGDVEMTVLSDGEAVKLRHIPTGEIALGADAHEAWIALKRKVMEVAGDA
ncbi:hypothetical protein GS982_13180 [Rhodococcus hoagii]|uniref:Uncharacterized protein n=1 Tax=Rhodococcus hoagii TaxID=43767 RepID=A0A9Q2P4D6_RHOHA|nr:hypothetical protein [Prescottella equi]MBM4492144.1 hypothetical protein [Prescottella equi]MBM4497653.1 hypothetical protein [Prescottella equi]MBM4509608.1 hypothetical protein [Prescottella equi]MBM4565390.1 hypothetical protein [Prescottella equi]MBM4594329.1 hypothetical protein [Prescottella equi]